MISLLLLLLLYKNKSLHMLTTKIASQRLAGEAQSSKNRYTQTFLSTFGHDKLILLIY
jgi:hypothetical protein